MIKVKRTQFISMIFVFIFIFGIMVFKTFSKEEEDWNNIEFSADRNAIRFFDRKEGKMYVYTAFEGKLENVWVLEELGQDMRKIK
ncbi:MAG: hypothetical protein KKF78_09710 [Candidatus Omnitrophica bacterium]|nr:hypothetical protein [Candidatus Omnitrophota bacterium]MBU1997415.1 hypothetical protein [Candidatus Omnitrophota bacterium]